MGGLSDYGGDLIFNYAYPISFLGGILYAVISLGNLNLADILANKAASVIINVIVGIAGLVSLSYWFQYDVPVVGGIVNSSVTTYGRAKAPKPQA
jgi:uncharacterized membrane protein YuzA (DUF378 family)